MDLIKGVKKVDTDNKLTILLLTGLSVFLFVAYLLSALRSYVNADAGYYLGVAELIHQGYVPYRDFGLGYTPLFFYALQIPRGLMGSFPNYTGYMLFLYLVVIVDAFLMAKIVHNITGSGRWAWLSGLVFLVLYYYLEGNYFILEAFSVCFGLVAMLLLAGEKGGFWRVFLAGAFSALSFLSKQYGLLFAGVIGVMMLFSGEVWKKRMWDCLCAALGFCTVMALFFMVFASLGLGPDKLVEALSGGGYGGQSVGMYFDGVKRTARLFPFLLFLPILFLGRNKSRLPVAMGCVIGVLAASLQFYFNVFSHYYVYMIPFVLVLSVMQWQEMRKQEVSRVLFLLYFGLLFTAIAIPAQEVYKDAKTLARHDVREPQTMTARQIRQIAEAYGCKTAYCYWNTIQYYALCPLQPSAMEKYGFSFGYDTDETYLERLQEADCFVVMKDDLGQVGEMEGFAQCLESGFTLATSKSLGETLVFVRKR